MDTLTKWNPFREMDRWNPFREMDELQNRLASFLGRSSLGGYGDRESITVSDWSPLVDITEDEKEYIVKAELPEVKKEDLSVTMENGVLTVSGERKREAEQKGKRYHRVERWYGSFTRSFTLPEEVDGARIRAEFKDGILCVHVPKSEKAKPRTIDVKIA